MSDDKLRRRTILSFSILGVGAAVFGGLWSLINRVDEDSDDEISPFFRRVLETNGGLWSPPSNRTSLSEAPPPGKIPRVNGDVGLIPSVDVEQWKLEVDT